MNSQHEISNRDNIGHKITFDFPNGGDS